MTVNKLQIQKRTKKLLKEAEKIKEFTKELQELLKFYVDKEATGNYQRIIPNTERFYGVPKPVLEIISAEIGKYGKSHPTQTLQLINTLWQNGSFEERDISAKAVGLIAKKEPKSCLKLIQSFLPDLDNWSICDVLATKGMGEIITSSPDKILPLCVKWAKDKNKWIRRFGIVSLWSLAHDKKYKISGEEFEVISILMKDEDIDVKKGVSWILRQFTKKDPQKVFEFLTRWAKANPTKDTTWIIKNGMKKLQEEKQSEILTTLN